MPSCWATRRASSTSATEQQPGVAVAAPQLHGHADDLVAGLDAAGRRPPTSRRRPTWRRARFTAARDAPTKRAAAARPRPAPRPGRRRRRRRCSTSPSERRSEPAGQRRGRRPWPPARATAPWRRWRTTTPADANTLVAARAGTAAPRSRSRRCTRGTMPGTVDRRPVGPGVDAGLDQAGHRAAAARRPAGRAARRPARRPRSARRSASRAAARHGRRCRPRWACRCAARAPGRRRPGGRPASTPVAHDQRADALRPAELVGADRDEVGAGRRPRPRRATAAACTASVCTTAPGARRPHERGHRGEGLDRADLVVDEHHRHERGPSASSARGERVEVDAGRRVARRRRGRRGPRTGSSTAWCSTAEHTATPADAVVARRARPGCRPRCRRW